jgi:hypothetical protein
MHEIFPTKHLATNNKSINQPTNLIRFRIWLGFMVFNASYNNISVISWQSVLLVGGTGVTGKNNRPAACH